MTPQLIVPYELLVAVLARVRLVDIVIVLVHVDCSAPALRTIGTLPPARMAIKSQI